MEGSRFRRQNNAEEEAAWLEETTPQNTRKSTKWNLRIFKEWQSALSNKVAANELPGLDKRKVDEVQDLTVDMAQMSPLSLDFWMTKVVGEIGNRSGGRYPARSLYHVVCGVNRHVCNVNGEHGVSMFAKGDRRFMTFRNALDAEMREANKRSVAKGRKMAESISILYELHTES